MARTSVELSRCLRLRSVVGHSHHHALCRARGTMRSESLRLMSISRNHEESRYVSHQSVAIMRRVVTSHVHPWQS